MATSSATATGASATENWALPSSFTDLLAKPIAEALDILLPPPPPLPRKKREAAAKAAKDLEKTSAFLSALASAPDTQTWNGAKAFSTTGEALLDLFNDLAPDITGEELFDLLDRAWAAHPETTLRIILHARSIHEGKGFKTGFFRSVAWLYENHPRTLFANLHLIVDPTCERERSVKRDAAKAERKRAANNGVEVLGDDGDVEKAAEPEYPPRPHGSFDDLNDILMLAVNGQLTTSYDAPFTAVDGALMASGAGAAFKRARTTALDNNMADDYIKSLRKDAFREAGGLVKTADAKTKTVKAKALEASQTPSKDTTEAFLSKLTRAGTKEARVTIIKDRVVTALADKKLQALYLAIIDLYAANLAQDIARLKAHNEYLSRPAEQRKEEGYGKEGTSPHLFGMSYAGKWAPSPGKSADKQLHVATALALRLFPGSDTKTARRKLQGEVLAPLRRVLEIPEIKMVRGPWTIEYAKVPSRAMAAYKDSFYAHDPRGMTKYLVKVASGQTTIAGASMAPHELLSEALYGGELGGRIADLQWATLVDAIRSTSENELSNCIAVADVSGSMGSMDRKLARGQTPNPIWPCVALTLLMSELSRAPWNGAFITFSERPRLEHVNPALTLRERASQLGRAGWGYSTDYNAVFKSILQAAQRAKLAPEDMVKKVFVFSDMQFNSSSNTAFGRTEHEGVVRMFAEAGYPMPEMVYWNLQAGAAKPVRADTPGVALVSGFSGALMKYFIKALGEPPEAAAGAAGGDDMNDWDDMKDELDEIGVKVEETKKKTGKKDKEPEKTPLQHMMAIVGAQSFGGLVVVD
ncbi:hypothetical protein VHUM_00425 [Vanrija humicola]|uniref:TROVE domain-containing protein n=1 Tax=Vanrija humicola TaxID=5417 RepID=A0A7D8Z7B0_VANHU|nr:hypothetical protein VHUM_00425 [Vanrija humicola]